MENKKIYGVYPGILSNEEKINSLDEAELFLNLDSMSKFIMKCHQDIALKRLPEIDLTEANYALEYLIYQTTRFGVAIPLPEEGKHVSITPDYVKNGINLIHIMAVCVLCIIVVVGFTVVIVSAIVKISIG